MTTRVANLGLAAATIVVAAGFIGIVQPKLARDVHAVKQRDDVFLLPPDDQLRAMTLGYRSAAVDMIWASLLVEYGIHHQEKRRFPVVHRYIAGIIALEPDFSTLYDFVDTLIIYQPGGVPSREDVLAVRTYLERGTVARPYDADIWLHYGQYLAFLAPTHLEDQHEIEKWRVDGANAIARAVELGSDPDRSIAATTILSKSGERAATIKHLQRLYAIADDPETRRQLQFKLVKLEGTLDSERSVSVVEHEWRSSYPFLSRGAVLLIGPRRRPAPCAGPATYSHRHCPKDWEAAVGD